MNYSVLCVQGLEWGLEIDMKLTLNACLSSDVNSFLQNSIDHKCHIFSHGMGEN